MTNIDSILAPWQVSLGRHHAYRLVCQLYLKGITADLLPYLQAVPELAQIAGMNLDQAGAEHQRLFGLNLFPFESIFLDTTGLLGGQVSDAVSHFYQWLEYQPDAASSSPDHIGHEFGLLAHLCLAESECQQNANILGAKQSQERQMLFLQAHLLRWLPPLLIAIQHQATSFYTALGELAWNLVHSHYFELASVSERLDSEPVWALPAMPSLLEAKQTGVREIADYLLTPAYSGIFLSWENIAALARAQELPRGFGGRQQLLLNLMRAAGQYNKLPIMLTGLRLLTERWQAAYRHLAEVTPSLAFFTGLWEQRSERTIQILHLIETQSASLEA